MKDPAQVRSVAVLRDRVGGGLVLQAAWGTRLYVEMTKEKKLAKVELTERLWQAYSGKHMGYTEVPIRVGQLGLFLVGPVLPPCARASGKLGGLRAPPPGRQALEACKDGQSAETCPRRPTAASADGPGRCRCSATPHRMPPPAMRRLMTEAVGRTK